MKTCGKLFVGLLMLVVFGCDLSEDDNGFLVFSKSFDFSISQDEWQVDFTDFPSGPNDSSYYELKFAYTDRPSNLGENQKSIMISGNNYSDDLFMFMKKKLTGLNPNTDYALVFEIELASNAPKGIVTDGGAPGDSVYLKAGATGTEPKKVIAEKVIQFSRSKNGIVRSIVHNNCARQLLSAQNEKRNNNGNNFQVNISVRKCIRNYG